ncbi:carbohydrate binding family 9 domain-containing protein, partial [bacterium]|nr:carbohydrate binding family 9 domain-containing protein [bacterium]
MKLAFIFLFMLISFLGFNQEKIEIQRIYEEIKLDGIINEPIWEQISPLPFIQHSPIYGNKPTEHTEARLAYDDNYLYIAGKLYDREKVQSTSLERDGGNASSDWFGVAIDSYNDKENAMAFFTTPSGLRWDATVLDGGVGNISLNTNWNSNWDVATSISDEGWFAEFRIPLSSLRFQNINGETVMGLITWRLLARNNEWDIFPDISPEHGPSSFYKISRAQEIVFRNIGSKKPVYVTPYVLGGIGRNFEHDQDKTKLISDDKYKAEAGLDLKYSITSNLTLDATINTDFAQVEADNQEINLSRFSLFFPEKRKFFQERSSNFELNFSDYNKVF